MTLTWPAVSVRDTGEKILHVEDVFRDHPTTTTSGRLRITPEGHGASYCAIRVKVDVDPDIGLVTVTEAELAVDCGELADPSSARGQVLGGLAQGLGIALIDSCLPGVADIHTHGVPMAPDVPDATVVFIRSERQRSGLGELPIIPVPPALATAVTQAAGQRVRHTPLRPDRVWSAITGLGA